MKIQQWLFKLLKKRNVTDGRTDGRTHGRTHGQRENSIPHHKQSLRGGGGYNKCAHKSWVLTLIYIAYILISTYSWFVKLDVNIKLNIAILRYETDIANTCANNKHVQYYSVIPYHFAVFHVMIRCLSYFLRHSTSLLQCLKPHSHCAVVATVHPDAGQPVYHDAPGHIS